MLGDEDTPQHDSSPVMPLPPSAALVEPPSLREPPLLSPFDDNCAPIKERKIPHTVPDPNAWDGAPNPDPTPREEYKIGFHVNEGKLKRALQFVRTGLDEIKALILADFCDDEVDALLGDPGFVRRVEYEQAKFELSLLRKLAVTTQANMRKGTSTEMRWMLSKINKARFGGTTTVADGGSTEIPDPIVIVEGR